MAVLKAIKNANPGRHIKSIKMWQEPSGLDRNDIYIPGT